MSTPETRLIARSAELEAEVNRLQAQYNALTRAREDVKNQLSVVQTALAELRAIVEPKAEDEA